jgi:hypothetical protein
LALRLNCAIELALCEAKAADKREHAAGVRIHNNHGAANCGHLLK